MAENAPQLNPANQGTLRGTICGTPLSFSVQSVKSATIGGVDWTACLQIINSEVDFGEGFVVSLVSDTVQKHADAEIRASFVVRLVGTNPIEQWLTHTFTADDNSRFARLADRFDIHNYGDGFVTDGDMLTVEIDVTVEEVKGMMPVIAPSKMQIVDLDDDRFSDMIVRVKGEDWEGIRCHKGVVCHQSETIRGAMEHATKESKEGIFEIGEGVATEENVPLVVRLMYDEYKEDTMDKHVLELFILADFLLCARVKHITLIAIKRLLTVDTFWPTLKAAVHIDDQYVVHLCARFASDPLAMATVLKNEEGKEIIDNADKEGVAALLVLMKAISELAGWPEE